MPGSITGQHHYEVVSLSRAQILRVGLPKRCAECIISMIQLDLSAFDLAQGAALGVLPFTPAIGRAPQQG
jgi:hypothetical protein